MLDQNIVLQLRTDLQSTFMNTLLNFEPSPSYTCKENSIITGPSTLLQFHSSKQHPTPPCPFHSSKQHPTLSNPSVPIPLFETAPHPV